MKFKYLFLLLVLALPIAATAAPPLSDHPNDDDVRIEHDLSWYAPAYHFDQKSVNASNEAYLLYWQFLGSHCIVKFGLNDQVDIPDNLRSIHRSAFTYDFHRQAMIYPLTRTREYKTGPDDIPRELDFPLLE